MMSRLLLLSIALALTAAVAASESAFPVWERLLAHYGGKNDDTSVPSMKMGNHMQMSKRGSPQPGDERRAADILAAARGVLEHYVDVRTALHDVWIPVVFGWMTHVYPDDQNAWAGMDMPMESNTAAGN